MTEFLLGFGNPFITHALTHSRTLIDAYPFRENGATAAQEIAYAISKVNKVNKATKALKNKKIHVLLSSGNNFIEEIAKFRAIRRLWLKMVPGTILEIYARTSASSLVKQKSWNNIARAALQALQAALGGADCIEIFPFDLPFRQKLTKVTKATLRLRSGQAKVTRGKEILNEWSKWAEQMAKDTHEVLRYEIGLLEAPFDPLAGSYEIDKKTEELEKEVLIELGKLNSLEPKEAQRYIQDSLQNLTRQNEAPIVGVMIQTQGPSPQPKRVKQ
ncbi:MAG: hypothetical protein HY401_08270 [Elusimicrobia bacterium]|nr:hypothetical protein [Elusimicrobiota bacterium]